MPTGESLSGQVAWITGGGKGIGKAIALELAGRGARVLVSGREERALGEAVGEIANAGGQARHIVGDVRNDGHGRDAVSRALELWGRLDIVIANAGLSQSGRLGVDDGPDGPTDGDRIARARAVIETNLIGTYSAFDAAIARMPGPGRLLAISSVLGKFGVPGQAAYCASKAGLHGLVRAVALEVGARRITCNAVCPGWVDTDMARARIATLAAEEGQTYGSMRTQAEAASALGRFVEPEEVARFVFFLCSRAADAITGQALSVCAGATAFAG